MTHLSDGRATAKAPAGRRLIVFGGNLVDGSLHAVGINSVLCKLTGGLLMLPVELSCRCLDKWLCITSPRP
jgi:hypothetical protein